MARNPDCKLCELHHSSKNVCIWGHGEGKGFVIGEAPGREEAKTGRPFMGRAGQFGRPILAGAGLEDPYITNVAKCRPPENRKPELSEIKTCLPYLLEEIKSRQPKVILLWGAVAMRAMIGRTKITEMNGQLVEKNGQKFVCCFHPAAVLRDPSKEKDFKMAVTRYAAVLNGTFDSQMPVWKAIDRDTFDEFIQDWIESKVISFDVETAGEQDGEGLYWWKKGFVVTSIAFSLEMPDKTERNWGLILDHYSTVLPEDMRLELLRELILTSGGKKFRAQNGKFDNLCLMKRYGVRFHLDEDSLLAHHLVDENSSHGLKQLARRFCGAPDYDLTDKEIRSTSRIPARRLLSYNAADAAYTRRLYPVFRKMMDTEERWLYDRVIMPAARAFEKIELNGLYVDVKKLNQVVEDEQLALNTSIKKLNKIAGEEVNWNSPAQVARILYGKLKLKPTVFTDKNNPSTGEEALVDIDHPVAKLLEEYRGHEKFLSTYTGRRNEDGDYEGGWREFMDGPHLYLSTKMSGTVTGRYSSRLHQVPRDGKIRNVITAPLGWEFIQMDLDQAELKVVAIVAREPTMLQIFRDGKDIHWSTLMNAVESGGGEYVDTVFKTARMVTKKKLEFPDAIQILRDMHPDEAIKLVFDWKEGRKKAKGINFGFIYDQTPPGFISYAKTKYGFEPTLDEATQFRNTFFHTYSALTAWHERQRKLARTQGFVRNLAGRKRRLPGIYSDNKSIVSEAERQAINAPIQGFIGDYKAMILVEIDETFSTDHLRIVGEHHDAILMWSKKEYTKSNLSLLKEIGDHPKLARECGLNFPIDLTVSMEVGPWGAGEKYKP